MIDPPRLPSLALSLLTALALPVPLSAQAAGDVLGDERVNAAIPCAEAARG